MSDDERIKSDNENKEDLEEEVDDLFGDDEEQNDQQDNRQSNEDDSENSQDEDEEAELKTIDISLPRHAVTSKAEEDTYIIKVPVFLNIEAHPFDPNEFKEQVHQNAINRNKSTMSEKQMKNDLVAEKLLNENSIRWRYSNSGDDEIIKQSNAHFVEWDDGSISLKVGNELFDFKTLPLFDNFLVKTHDTYEILQNDSILNKSANLLPSSTFTSTHRKLTEALKYTQKKDTILNTITEKDPELKQRLADENERKTMKLKRQIEQRRRLQEEKLGKSSSPAPGGRNNYESAYERFERTYANEDYDDEDDFVANDDDEVEEEEDGEDFDDEEDEFDKGAERLKKLKDDGEAKYKKKSSSPSDDEGATQRKRRRIIDSDEDDD